MGRKMEISFPCFSARPFLSLSALDSKTAYKYCYYFSISKKWDSTLFSKCPSAFLTFIKHDYFLQNSSGCDLLEILEHQFIIM